MVNVTLVISKIKKKRQQKRKKYGEISFHTQESGCEESL